MRYLSNVIRTFLTNQGGEVKYAASGKSRVGVTPMSTDLYREQLTGLARAMALPNQENEVAAALAEQFTTKHVRLFVEGNLEKRIEKLTKQLSFVAETFSDFERLVMDYIRATPLAAYDTGTSDGESMLAWLERTQSLTPEQQDYITCQRARHAVEELARTRRLQYVEFQERYSLVETFLEELETNSSLRVFLNPIRVWTTFQTTTLLDEGAGAPANVLFFAVSGEVATALLELEGQALVNELADYQPCTIGEWSAASAFGSVEDLTGFVRELAQMGLASLG